MSLSIAPASRRLSGILLYTSLRFFVIAVASAAPLAHAGTWEAPELEGGQALSADAAEVTDLGFADLHGASGARADGDALFMAWPTPDGGALQLQMDPISGELKSVAGTGAHQK